MFTIPKRLRIFFRFDRRLLGELPRLAWQTVLEVYRTVLDRRDVTPGMIGAIHTFGELLHFHTHLHALVTDGAFAGDGSFVLLPGVDDEPFEKLWQKKVFDLLLKRGKISEALVTQMRGWTHSGFGVHHAVRLDADDRAGRERLAHCGLADEPPRAPPHASPPGLGELQYVSDLEFVHDPGPAEPVWSAD